MASQAALQRAGKCRKGLAKAAEYDHALLLAMTDPIMVVIENHSASSVDVVVVCGLLSLL
jgi:hypothetical protein